MGEYYMLRSNHVIILILIIFCFASPAISQEKYSVQTDPATKNIFFIFEASKGNVRFNHTLHQFVMKAESCLPCHKTKTPTREHTMTRFDEKVAHYFCRGCHRDKGNGPVECHECHKNN
jgi:hypothetical protein